MTTNEIYEAAANLFDGGWRSTDVEEIKDDYELTNDEADDIIDALKEIEKDYITYNGHEYKLDDIDNLMDAEILEELHAEYSPCDAQFFFEKYLEAHYEKYNEEFIIG
jgi:hypothetical protein